MIGKISNGRAISWNFHNCFFSRKGDRLATILNLNYPGVVVSAIFSSINQSNPGRHKRSGCNSFMEKFIREMAQFYISHR